MGVSDFGILVSVVQAPSSDMYKLKMAATTATLDQYIRV